MGRNDSEDRRDSHSDGESRGSLTKRHGDREGDRHKSGDRDRDKERSREGEKDKERRERDHRRDRGRSRDSDRERRRRSSRERRHRTPSRSRSRSRSRDRRRRSRDRSRDRSRRHRRSHSRSHSRSRDRKKSKKDSSVSALNLPPVLGAATLLLNAHGAANGPNTSAALLAAQQAQRSRVWVGNITYEVGEEHIRQAFESMCGAIKKIDMSNDPSTGRHRGYCFIEFFSPDSAQTALMTMSGYNLGGRGIKVGTPNGAPVPSPAAVNNPTLAALMAQQQAGELAKSLGISKPGGIPPTVVMLPTKSRSSEVKMPVPPPLDPLAAQAAAAQMLSAYTRMPTGS